MAGAPTAITAGPWLNRLDAEPFGCDHQPEHICVFPPGDEFATQCLQDFKRLGTPSVGECAPPCGILGEPMLRRD
jgi:hypothetical protein